MLVFTKKTTKSPQVTQRVVACEAELEMVKDVKEVWIQTRRKNKTTCNLTVEFVDGGFFIHTWNPFVFFVLGVGPYIGPFSWNQVACYC